MAVNSRLRRASSSGVAFVAASAGPCLDRNRFGRAARALRHLTRRSRVSSSQARFSSSGSTKG